MRLGKGTSHFGNHCLKATQGATVMGINQEPTAKTALHLEYKKEQKHTTLFVFKQAPDNAFPTIPSRGAT